MAKVEQPLISADIEPASASTNLIQIAMTALRLHTTTVETFNSTNGIRDDLPEICLSEVAEHDSSRDCWIVIYDRVYDVTKFLKWHPGNDGVILEQAGRDATIAFRGTGHSEFALKSLKKWEIGQLPPHERLYRCNKGLCTTDLPE